MTAPRLLPPRDLLEQIEGVEGCLRRGRGARATGLVVGTVQVVILLANSDWLNALLKTDWDRVLDQWPLLLCLVVLVLSVLVAGWTRFWLRESRQPFRYTYSVAPFEPVTDEDARPRFVPIHADLRERLSQRIRRLSLLDPPGDAAQADAPAEPQGAEAARAESHVHITGYYAIRRRPPDERPEAEVSAWVRVGGPEKPARLAEPVIRFALNEPVDGDPAEDGELRPEIDPEQYEGILERTYFSVATELYRQIGEDVSRKIQLLPNRWFRASALYYEAQDYARSNTLDAYNQARALYEGALAIYDPRSAVLPKGTVRRALALVRIAVRVGISWLRRRLSGWIPRLGRSEVLAARAQIGYANTLLDSWVIAPLSGLRAAATYEAVPIAERAVQRLDDLARDVPGRAESLFDARVAFAFAHATLDAREEGREELDIAVADDPLRAERDPRYLFVRALLEDRLHACIPLYRRAVELDPRFEAALFQLAASAELVWRTRRKLDESIATTIFEQYGKVLKLNPGNIAAWANTGYMEWLLHQPERAERRFEGGLRFKEIKQEAYVAELDQGLARIAAERGEFELAYRHYYRAASAVLSQGWAARSFADYHFDRISRAILARFEEYLEAVDGHHRAPSDEEARRTTPWLRDSVLSYALYDYSQACFRYFWRTHNYTMLEKAYDACVRAIELNDQFVLAIYLRYQLESAREEFVGTRADGRLLERIEDLLPAWPSAAHELLRWRNEQAKVARRECSKARRDEAQYRSEAERLTKELEKSLELTRYEESVSLQSSVEEPARLLRAAERRARDAKRQEEIADQHEAEALKLSRTLLPHRWLWDPKMRLAWRAVTSAAARHELRWERSFEPFHVSVLVAWCRFIADRPEGAGHVDKLLDLIEKRFLPSDLELIKFRGERAAASGNGGLPPEAYRDRIERIVRGLLTSDESTFVALKELDPKTPTAYEVFAKVAAMPDLSPYLYHWLGRQLLEHWKSKSTPEPEAKEAALQAYLRARDIKQPDARLELADELEELGAVKEREELYEEAADSPGNSLRRLEQLMRHFDRRGDFERVLSLLKQASTLDADSAAPAHAAEYYSSRRARALFLSGRFDKARDELTQIPPDGGALGSDWRFQLTSAIVERGDETALARLRDWLGAQQRTAVAGGSRAAAKDAGLAALYLAHEKRRGLWRAIPDLETESRLRMPVAQPIVIEAHRDYFREGAQTPGVRRLISVDIPALRTQIQIETGVFVPGFRLRSGVDLPERGYRIRLHGVAVMQGTLDADTGDAYGDMIERAATAIRRSLSSFVDLQLTANMLGNRDIGDDRRRCAFTSLLKRLVEDGVPIGDVDVLVKACDGKELLAEELPAIAHAIRARLREQLPGRRSRAIVLPPELEAKIAEHASLDAAQPERSMPAAQLSEVREELRALRATEDSFDAVFVASPRLRRTVRRIVALDMPVVPVLSRDELRAPAPQARGISRLASLGRRG